VRAGFSGVVSRRNSRSMMRRCTWTWKLFCTRAAPDGNHLTEVCIQKVYRARMRELRDASFKGLLSRSAICGQLPTGDDPGVGLRRSTVQRCSRVAANRSIRREARDGEGSEKSARRAASASCGRLMKGTAGCFGTCREGPGVKAWLDQPFAAWSGVSCPPMGIQNGNPRSNR